MSFSQISIRRTAYVASGSSGAGHTGSDQQLKAHHLLQTALWS